MKKSCNAGTKNARHTLTKKQVIRIRQYFSYPKLGSGTMQQAADILGVSLSTIRKIVEEKTWTKVITPLYQGDYSQDKPKSAKEDKTAHWDANIADENGYTYERGYDMPA